MRKRQTGGLINRTGYLKGAPTNRNAMNIIPSGHITTEGMIGPISANGITLHPDTGDYHFDSPFVVERKLRKGGSFRPRKMQQGGTPGNNAPDPGIRDFYRGYLNSPNYLDRLQGMGYTNPQQTIQARIDNINKARVSTIPGAGGSYNDKRHLITFDPEQSNEYPGMNRSVVIAHEYSHAGGAGQAGRFSSIAGPLVMNSKEIGILNGRNKYNQISDPFAGHTTDQAGEIIHDQQPGELKADIDALRYKLKKDGIYDTGTQEFNQQILNKIKPTYSKDPNFSRTFDRLSDKDLIYIMNNVASNQSVQPGSNAIADTGPTSVIPQAAMGGHTITTPQYLSTYPNDKNTLPPMKKSLKGRSMKNGGRTYDPQLGNYVSNIYQGGGLAQPGYPYFGYNDAERGGFSGLMMQMGGPMPPPGPQLPQMIPPNMPQPTARRGRGRKRMQAGGDINVENAARSKASGYDEATAVDRLNSILAGTSANRTWGNPQQNALSTQASIWHQTHPGVGPEQTIQGFFGQPVTPGNPVDSVRQRMNNIGYGPVNMYHTTPDLSVAPNATNVATRYQIGGSTSVPSWRTRGITDQYPPDLSHGEVSDDWKDVMYDNPDYKKGGKWIQGAINPSHKGWCTPLSNPHCTGHRRALALMFKHKHGFHKKQDGGAFQTGMEMQQGGTSPTPFYNFSRLNWEDPTHHVPDAKDSALYRSYFNDMIQNPTAAMGRYGWINSNLSSLLDHSRSADVQDSWGSNLNAYQDAINQTKRPKQKKGGSLRGKMQAGGPAAFTPAGSLIDQNQWSMGSNGTPVAPVTGNYYKPDPTQTATPNPIPTSPRPGMSFTQTRPNTNLSWLLPLNAGLNVAAQANQNRQNMASRAQTNNPLVTEGYDNGRTTESKYGYGLFQGGGETMPFAGIPLHLWQQGGATQAFHPYMLRKGRYRRGGRYQAGGLMDQWDLEDAQDQIDQPQSQQDEPEDMDPSDWDLRRRSDLSNDQDYEMALREALSSSPFNTNPYGW